MLNAVAVVLTLVLFAPLQNAPARETPPDSQPAVTGTRRVPKQAEVLRDLLREQDRPTPILPRSSAPFDPRRPSESAVGPEGLPLLLEGTMLVERPGRLIIENGAPFFVFSLEGEPQPRKMKLLENELLDAMERSATSGSIEFVISAEVTRYRNTNNLILRKILRRVSNGNLGP